MYSSTRRAKSSHRSFWAFVQLAESERRRTWGARPSIVTSSPRRLIRATCLYKLRVRAMSEPGACTAIVSDERRPRGSGCRVSGRGLTRIGLRLDGRVWCGTGGGCGGGDDGGAAGRGARSSTGDDTRRSSKDGSCVSMGVACEMATGGCGRTDNGDETGDALELWVDAGGADSLDPRVAPVGGVSSGTEDEDAAGGGDTKRTGSLGVAFIIDRAGAGLLGLSCASPGWGLAGGVSKPVDWPTECSSPWAGWGGTARCLPFPMARRLSTGGSPGGRKRLSVSRLLVLASVGSWPDNRRLSVPRPSDNRRSLMALRSCLSS